MQKYDPSKLKAKVMLGVPSRNNSWWSDFGMSLTAMAMTTAYHAPEVAMILNNTVGTGLCMNRINLCKAALKNNCTHILFLDDDMRIPMQTLIHLLHHDLMLVAANCARKELPPRSTAKGFDGNCVWTRDRSTGLEEVESIGTGVMLINTKIFKDMPQPWFAEVYNVEKETSTGEDVFFCQQARKLGHKIYIDHDVSKEVAHMGGYDFRHQISEEWLK